MALFESYERRIDKINSVLNSYGIASIEEAEKITKDAGLNVYDQVKKIQPICFENACWAYTVGAAIAIKKGCRRAADAAAAIGEGLQAFCIPGSVADQRKVGLGHGNLGKMLLEEETDCFCFLAGHESFAAAEGAIGIAEKANKVRKKPLRVILNGLGKDAAQIISRINGFTYVETKMNYYTGEVEEVFVNAAVLVDPAIGEAGDVDTALVSLKFKNGAIGVIDNCRKASYGYDQRLEVFGSKAQASAANDTPTHVAFIDENGKVTDKPLYFFLERYMQSFTDEMTEFIDCVLHDKPTKTTVEDGLQALRMGLAAKKSLAEHRPVKLSEIEA